VEAGASPTITNNVIWKNVGCGILAVAGASPLIQGNTISLNHGPSLNPLQCGSPLGGGYVGTGIALVQTTFSRIIGNTIIDNLPDPAPDVVIGYGISFSGDNQILVKNNIIGSTQPVYNIAVQQIDDAAAQSLLLIQNIFVGVLWSNGEGGGVSLLGSVNAPPYPTLTEVNNTFSGAGESFTYNYGPSIVSNTIFDELSDVRDPVGCNPAFNNSAVNLTYDLLHNDGAQIDVNPCTEGAGIISADAQFVDPSSLNFRLQPTSPALNAGSVNEPDLPTADFAGKNRFVCGTIDLGAYEHHPAPPIALTSSTNPSVGGNAVTISAHVTGNCNIPTGVLTFFDGVAQLGAGTLDSSGDTSFTTASLTVGTHTITASYPGDFNFDASTSAGLTQVVTGYPTATTLVSVTPNPASSFQVIFLTGSVASQVGTPNGTLSFFANGQVIASATLNGANGSAQASATVNTLGVGTYNITAVYNPTVDYAGSTSNTIVEVVDGTPTAVSLESSLNPSTYGQSVTFTAIVNATQSSTIPTGTVSFHDGSSAIGAATLNSSGTGAFIISAFAVGSHPITAVYSGSSNDNASTSTVVNQIVSPSPTTIELTGTPNPANSGETVTLTASVTFGGSLGGVGSVTFADQFGVLGTAAIANGQAVLTTNTLGIGTHNITASSASGGTFAAGTSPVLAEVIEAHDFEIALIPVTLSLASGQKGQVAVQLTSLGSYSGTLNLTASEIPTYASLSFTPTSPALAAAGGSTSIQLSVNTASLPPGVGRNEAPGLTRRLPFVLVATCCVFPLIFGRRRRFASLSAVIAALALSVSLSGCSNISYPLNRVAPGTYVIPISATDPTTQTTHTAQFTLVVTD
jgi:hypothetical protein